jgi:septal ring-binding cell division protein DamX
MSMLQTLVNGVGDPVECGQVRRQRGTIMPGLHRNRLITTGSALAVMLLSACASNDVTVRDSGKTYPPTETVEILSTAPQRAYERLAVLTATGDTLPRIPRNRNAVLKQLGDQAKAMGADAVIISDEKATVERWGVVHTITGTAIKYAGAPAAASTTALVAEPVQVEKIEAAPEAAVPTSTEPALVPETVADAPAAAPAATPPAAGGDWISQQDPDHYTIQLLASPNPDTLDRFIDRHALSGAIGRFTSELNGNKWYTLVYGSFPTRETARGAIDDLPPSLRESSPWVRRIGDIQALVTSN